ncbi:MAG TPA: radical SAM protein [Candidatus Aminicenantes bacterium]|nr:radical SAM protein [Candidatus Aminicenantes bacterium]HRY66286.1 radical SAM protein [Candidatus Aminicenantes bacterium]HRZ73194.1 radical SAM protein [Candidatus Aminicenantes bacterium]
MPGPVVREIEAKSILNASKIYDYCVNPYTGCQVGCAYCYAALFMRRYSGHSEPWGDFVDAKVNAPALLARQIVKARRGKIWFSSVCDSYQPLEERYGLTRRSLEVLAGRDFPVVIQTKSVRIRRDIDVIRRIPEVEVGFSVASDDESIIRAFERTSSPVAERIEALREFRAAGVATYAFAGPLLPGNPERLAALLDGAVDRVLIDRMNYVPAVRALYARQGLLAALTDAFFRDQADRLAKALRARGIAVEKVF